MIQRPPSEDLQTQSIPITRLEKLIRSRVYRTVVIINFVFVGAIIYGAIFYPNLPHSVGGGKPATMILVFDSAENLQLLSLTANQANPRWTAPVFVLAELTNGVLVMDSRTKLVVEVKNEFIVSRIDDQKAPVEVTISTLTPSPTP